jgi:hypothetical protein
MKNWRPDLRSRISEPLSVDLAFGTTPTAVELAAQRFIQTHNQYPTDCRELARRLLQSTPGSIEEGVVREELAVSLTTNRVTPRLAGGGDARAVLARLRRPSGTH